MILLTGAAGFIGSCMLSFLNSKGINDIIIVDDFSIGSKLNNWNKKRFNKKINRNNLFEIIHALGITSIIHLGAKTDTIGKEWSVYNELNLIYSKKLWNFAKDKSIPFLYASSAATYGNGKLGFKDNHGLTDSLIPLNLYGKSKNDFDIWALEQKEKPPKWYGFKFFNVYGPNEFHKGRMASVILHTFKQINSTDGMKLFKSHHVDYKNGEQRRDFIYVKDVIKTLHHFLENDLPSGLFNLGTGKSRTFLDLAKNVFNSLNKKNNISFIDTPLDIRENYQYFTEADTNKLSEHFDQVNNFHSLEDGIKDYVQNYLIPQKYF